MTRKSAKRLLKPFVKKAKKDNDAFFYCFFSREEDKFVGDFDGMDYLDATILVRQLVKSFPEVKTYLQI